MAKEETAVSKMETKAIRKELVKRFGYDKGFVKAQPRERLVSLLTVDRKEYAFLEEVKADLVTNYGYDPEYVARQAARELIRQRSLEEAGRIATERLAKGKAEPEAEEPKPKRKSRAKKPAPVSQAEALDIEMGMDAEEPKPKRKSRAKASAPAAEEIAAEVEEKMAEEVDGIEAEYAAALATPNVDMRFDGEVNLLIKDEATLDYVFDGHAGAGPSASERWLTCTASLGLSRKFLETLTPNQQKEFAKANLSARQGTTAHAVGETEANLLLGRIDDVERDNLLMHLTVEPEDGEAYDEEMAEYVQEYTDLIRQYIEEKGPENILIERRVAAYVPLAGDHEDEVYEVPGSADLIGLPTPEDKTLVVGDLKYGNGVEVEVEENTQGLTYALGVLSELVDDDGNLTVEIDTIRIHIIQPRLGGIKTWEITLDDLLEWRDSTLGPQLTKALYGPEAGATFEPSEKACQFCPAKGTCPALAEQRLADAAQLFDVIVETEFANGSGALPPAEAMDNATLGSLLTQVNGLMDLQKELKAEVTRRMHRGDQVPGFKMVSYTPKRTWKPDAAEELMDIKALWKEPELMTPTQAIKTLTTLQNTDAVARVQEYIDVPDKKPVIAPENDKRKPWVGKAPEDMFSDETKVEAEA